jgi:hypothetical protein
MPKRIKAAADTSNKPPPRKPKKPVRYSNGGTGAYAAKLTLEQRCAVFWAFRHEEISIDRLAEIVGIDRRTIQKLVDINHRSYKDVKQQYANLGVTAFRDKYWIASMQRWLKPTPLAIEYRQPSA